MLRTAGRKHPWWALALNRSTRNLYNFRELPADLIR